MGEAIEGAIVEFVRKTFWERVIFRIRRAWGSRVDLLSAFPAYSPNSRGKYLQRSRLVEFAIEHTPSALVDLLASMGVESKIYDLPQFLSDPTGDDKIVIELGEFFDHYGSDKATHGYHHLYGALFGEKREQIERVLEIGIGSSSPLVVSNMGSGGRPGASLRAFADFFPKAVIFGGDIDRTILFSEGRIKGVYFNQLNPPEREALGNELGDFDFDLVIDDGLHLPIAGINSLKIAMEILKPGGFFVAEDIPTSHLALWQIVSHMVSAEGHLASIVRFSQSHAFVFEKAKPWGRRRGG